MVSLLFVEDEPLVRFALSNGLRQNGFTVTEADSAEEAMELWTAGKFDVVLSDIRLPNADGFALAEYIRSDEARMNAKAAVRLVALTGATFMQGSDDRIATAFDAVLQKPIRIKALVSALHDDLSVSAEDNDPD